MNATALKSKINALYQRAEPILNQSKIIASNSIEKSLYLSKTGLEKARSISQEALVKGEVVSKKALEKSRVLSKFALEKSNQYSVIATNQLLSSSLYRHPRTKQTISLVYHYSGILLQWTVKLSNVLLLKLYASLKGIESFICGPVRSFYLICKHFFAEIYHTQDLSPPSFESWPAAKRAYAQLWASFQQRPLLDYTWREIGIGFKLALELSLFYYFGKFVGTRIHRSS